MNEIKTKARIETLDLLKGLVIIIMAIDHVRDYFHYSELVGEMLRFFYSIWGTDLSPF